MDTSNSKSSDQEVLPTPAPDLKETGSGVDECLGLESLLYVLSLEVVGPGVEIVLMKTVADHVFFV